MIPPVLKSIIKQPTGEAGAKIDNKINNKVGKKAGRKIGNKEPAPPLRQRGAVIIMVLWTAVILTIMVTVLASNVRLSATTAWHNKAASTDFAAVMAAMNKAEMELMMERMPQPIGEELSVNEFGEFRIPAYRFNGQPLDLSYSAAENMVVRIYDHAGKINLNRIQPGRMRQILQKQLGPDYSPSELDELMAAWIDWTDLNSMPSPGGAEDEYYLSLDPPYTTRNNPELDTVEELRLIRGFDELFRDVNLNAAFTIYGSNDTVNLNMATREAMRLLPGLDDALIEEIIAHRQVSDLRNLRDVGELVPLERMVELSPWVGNNTSSFYSVYVYPRVDIEDSDTLQEDVDLGLANPDPVTQAYMHTIEVRAYNTRARVYRVHPYAQLPDTSPPRVQ